ncbi:nucleotidyltransferase domain-containing protein [Kribbella monticola]|uniref:nucleotidyltransferase domain-containing protein n=1 Tax=Kribbella monticola TaxID=2185285 RepID=UPI0013002D83|nr:nucleotidyltransferase [Kribbella monticola]
MGLSAKEREALLTQWIKPSSDSEQDQQERAERMVKNAVSASDQLKRSRHRIYTKGSYRNNTNVRRDSDVDVVVELYECVYYDYFPGVTPESKSDSYTGSWNPTTWRTAIRQALENYFGASEVDSSGKIAIEISEKLGSRPSTDVVPSFEYHRYDSADQSNYHVGSCVFTRDTETKIVNWPQQQYDNGVAKNNLTGGRYKRFVRALKNAENVLVAAGNISDLPSYFMECLVYNASNYSLKYGSSLSDGFSQTLVDLYGDLNDGTAFDTWQEPNELKWLFKGAQKWSVEDGKKLIAETWSYLGYGD